MNEISNMYEELVQSYIKVNTSTNIPIPKLVLAEACLKIARFLMTVFLNGGWNDDLISQIVQSPTIQVLPVMHPLAEEIEGCIPFFEAG